MTEAQQKQEEEANSFALTLLMPEHLFIRELNKKPVDLSDENCTRYQEIAKTFGVSLNAVVARIQMLTKLKKL